LGYAGKTRRGRGERRGSVAAAHVMAHKSKWRSYYNIIVGLSGVRM
jgi:hypothetical protein